jgi:hypothetical protein
VAFLADKLSQLNTSAKNIGELMVFGVENAGAASAAIVEHILGSFGHGAEKLSNFANHSLALVYLLNDLMCNSKVLVLEIGYRLVEFGIAIRSVANSPSMGRISRTNFVAAVLRTFQLWKRRFFSPPQIACLLHVAKLKE